MRVKFVCPCGYGPTLTEKDIDRQGKIKNENAEKEKKEEDLGVALWT